MRILLLTQVLPHPPDSGPKIKTANVLRYLAQRHEVHLVSFVRSASEQQGVAALRPFCSTMTTVPLRRSRVQDLAHLVRSLATGRPFLIERDDSPAMRRAIERLLRRHRFDAVHADQLSMAQFAADLPLPLRVLDQHNAVWTIVRRAARREAWSPRRLLAELEWRKLRAYEWKTCERFDRVTVVSADDRRALFRSGSGRRAAIIPIAVDTRELAFAPRTEAATDVLSLATMFYPPNLDGVHWFAQEVFPAIRRAVPSTRFSIVGSRPPAKIARLASAEGGIEVTGYVADLAPILARSAVLVVPLHSGSGMRVKILEAFARGVPVVSTPIGCEGIDALDGEHLLVADGPDDFARAVVRVLTRPDEAARLARAARELVVARYDWRTALAEFDEVYADQCQPPIGSRPAASLAAPTAALVGGSLALSDPDGGAAR